MFLNGWPHWTVCTTDVAILKWVVLTLRRSIAVGGLHCVYTVRHVCGCLLVLGVHWWHIVFELVEIYPLECRFVYCYDLRTWGQFHYLLVAQILFDLSFVWLLRPLLYNNLIWHFVLFPCHGCVHEVALNGGIATLDQPLAIKCYVAQVVLLFGTYHPDHILVYVFDGTLGPPEEAFQDLDWISNV